MEKIKPTITNWIESEKGKDILMIIIVILVGLGSFELGRLSKANSSAGIQIEYPKQIETEPASAINAVESATSTPAKTKTSNSAGKNFFASNKGTKYYSLGCSAGKSLKQENRIYFATKEEAEKAGYTLSASCN